MMTRRNFNLNLTGAILTLIFAWGLQGCTGYDDGPLISFRSEEAKIANAWRIQGASLRGVEVTVDYNGDFYRFQEGGTFQRLDAAKFVSYPPFTQDATITANATGTWKFLKDNKIEIFYAFIIPDPYDSDVSYREEHYEVWQIDRLTPEELWLRNDSLTFKMGIFE